MEYLDLDNLHTILLDDAALDVRQLQRVSCGVLNLTSGRLVACDPAVQPEREAFSRAVDTRGPCPVELIVDAGSNALAVLWLRDRCGLAAADLSWELALMDGQEMAQLKDDEFFGYPVDAGLGCFMDLDAAGAIAQRDAKEQENEDEYVSYFDNAIGADMGEEGFLDHYPLGDGSPHNCVIFSSGWGDGVYASFWALDRSGVPVALVTDFGVISGGDARSEEMQRQDAYEASLPPEKKAALNALGEAVGRGDVGAIDAALARGLVHANEIIPASGETAINEAIRLNQTASLRRLLGEPPRCPAMPEELHTSKWDSYLGYALGLKQARDPELVALLTAAQVD